MNIYQKLQKLRVELQNMNLKPSGKNTYSNYVYYELSDFLPAVNALCDKHSLFTKFNIVSNKEKGIAVLKITNSEKIDESETFTSETAEVEIGKKKDGSGGAEPIQNLGGKTTYMKRYVYMNAFEIAEPDMVEAINKQITEEVSQEDQKEINKAKDLAELTKTCGNLKNKYKINLITPLYEAAKIKLEQKASKA